MKRIRVIFFACLWISVVSVFAAETGTEAKSKPIQEGTTVSPTMGPVKTGSVSTNPAVDYLQAEHQKADEKRKAEEKTAALKAAKKKPEYSKPRVLVS